MYIKGVLRKKPVRHKQIQIVDNCLQISVKFESEIDIRSQNAGITITFFKGFDLNMINFYVQVVMEFRQDVTVRQILQTLADKHGDFFIFCLEKTFKNES